MRRRPKSLLEINHCPECDSRLDDTVTAIYICADNDEALRIVGILGRSILAAIDGRTPRRVYVDGTWTLRADIVKSRFGGELWYTGSGLRLSETKLTWGPTND